MSSKALPGCATSPKELEQLAIGATKRKLDLSILARFEELTILHLEGQSKRIEVVSGLSSLEELTLRSDMALFPRVGELRYLELWLVKGLSDIPTVGRLPHLRHLFLQALKQVQSVS